MVHLIVEDNGIVVLLVIMHASCKSVRHNLELQEFELPGNCI